MGRQLAPSFNAFFVLFAARRAIVVRKTATEAFVLRGLRQNGIRVRTIRRGPIGLFLDIHWPLAVPLLSQLFARFPKWRHPMFRTSANNPPQVRHLRNPTCQM